MKQELTPFLLSKLIYKSISKSISESDQAILEIWLSDKENKKRYLEIVKSENILNKISIYNKLDKEASYQKVQERILLAKKKTGKIRIFRITRYAAVFVGIIGLALFYKNSTLFQDSQLLKIDKNAITLQLENGNIKIITENGSEKIVGENGKIVGIQSGNKLEYKNTVAIEKLTYNELTIPYGKRFEIVLSDGTKVFLNSGSSIKYPVKFIEGKNREVFLKGEAFFDVTKDRKHPFIVNANEIDITVLGTQFNVSYYPEDIEINTVLVEGSVALQKENSVVAPILLKPGYKASWNTAKKEMLVEKVDTAVYTAWKTGILYFKNIQFEVMKRKLERQFNVEIENRFKFLDAQVYTASFNNNEKLEDILNYLKEDTPFNYKIEENKVIIIATTKTQTQMK
tara:strand:- start:21411 stop:22607 length:1197 start_codon:yes stop_codon:yes gene_type:complete